MSLTKLKSVQLALQDKEEEKALFESSKSQLYHKVDNTQLMSTAATVHWTLPFCISICSAQFFGSALLAEPDCVLDFDDDGELENFLRNRKLR